MSDSKKTLVRRRELDERAERILSDALRGRGGAITKADAVALTGLPADDAEGALRTLLSRYRSHLAVTDQGELVYRFDPSMERRDAVTLGERLRQVGQALWKGFTFLFKIWIVATLVFYTIAFFVMMLALLFARSGSDRDDDDGGFVSPWLIWWLMPGWGPEPAYRGDRRLDAWGSPGRRQLAGKQAPDKRFYQSVFDFVFGPRQPAADPLAQDREVVGFLRSFDGRITATDVVSLTGWSYQRADEEMTRLMADYDGEVEVREDGTLLYVFPSLRRTAGEVGEGRWSYAWGRTRSLAPLTGNTTGANTAITVMNGFNLLAALVIAPAFVLRFGVDPQLAAWLTTVPLAFSGVFYAVPGVRALVRSRKQKRLAEETARTALVGEILSREGTAATPEELVASASRKVPLDAAQSRRLLDKLLVELDGDVETSATGEVRYVFPRVTAELRAVHEARRLASANERSIGELVFSSDEEGSGEIAQLSGSTLRPDRTLN